jgi:hypothetical protein
MTRFYLGSDGLWKHKGWTPVAPGDSPLDPTVPGTDTGGGAGGGGGRVLRFYTTDVVSNGVNLGGGGGGGATGATYFGAEPNPAGNSTTSQQGLINKWGGRPASRHYFGANSTGLPVHIAGISVAQWSWSWGSLDAQVVAGNHDAYFASCAAAMKNGDIATYAHESDNKGLTGTALSNRIGAMNRFYDVFKNTKPGVFVSPTHTGYMFSPKNPSGAALRTTWGAVKGDLIGLDLDGVHMDNGNYPGATDYTAIDYLGHVTVAKNFITANKARGYIGWTVPETMTSRITSFDPTGSKRAAWFQKNLTYMKNGGAYAVHVWDFPRPANLGGESTAAFNVIPNPSPEYTVVKSFIAGNPANPA